MDSEMASDNICKRNLKIVVRIMVLGVLFISGTGATPSEQWNKTFGGTGIYIAYSVQQTSDGGYILAGTSNLNPQYDNPYAWLIKTDGNGNQLWNKTIGLTTYEAPPFVQNTKDGGFVFGMTAYDGAGGFTIRIFKFDENGNQQWSRTFGNNQYSHPREFAHNVQQTSDGGYIIAGRTNDYGGARLVKTDKNGNLQWNKIIGEDPRYYYTMAYSVQQTLDNGYIFLANQKGAKNLLIQTDLNGSEQWNKTFGYQNSLNSVHQTSDGGFILGGKVGLIKTDANGNQQWIKGFPCELWGDTVDAVQQVSDGGYILWGKKSVGPGGSGCLSKTDTNGNEEWNITFPAPHGAFIISARKTSDGGYILSGLFDKSGGSSHALLLKLSKDEATTPVPTVTPTLTPTVTLTAASTPTATPQLEQEVKDLKERLNKTEEMQSQQESRISWLESTINSLLNWLKSIF